MEEETLQEYDWREEARKLLSVKSDRTMDIATMLPTKFQPVPCRQFILELEGIDSFLVKDVTRSPTKKTLFGYEKKGTLVVCLYDSVSPSTAQQVREWLSEGYWKGLKGRKAALRLLDPVGTTVSLTRFKGVKLLEVQYSHLRYSGSDLNTYILLLEYGSEDLEF